MPRIVARNGPIPALEDLRVTVPNSHKLDAVRLHLVTGKGGVGKSAVSVALALCLARRGRRVLAIELGCPGGLSRFLGAKPSAASVPTRTPLGVWLAFFDGDVALAEYLRSKTHLGPFVDVIVAHPLYRAFVGAAPGLRELMAVGKLRDELVRAGRLRRRWDAVVVDAGASGQAIEHLRMPVVASRTFESGLVQRETRRLAAFLADPGRTALHVVATPEELPLQEASDLVSQAKTWELALGRVLVNRCREVPPPGIARALQGLEQRSEQSLSARTLLQTAHHSLMWIDVQETKICHFEQSSKIEVLRLPLLREPLGTTGISRLADAWEAAQ